MTTFKWQDQVCEVSCPRTHTKCRDNEKRAPGYTERLQFADELVLWTSEFGGYSGKRTQYTAPSVLAGPVWAHPADYSLIGAANLNSYMPMSFMDDEGKISNPVGRTGMAGRGLLGKWGGNFAADPIVTYFDGTNFRFLGIVRGDGGGIAIPGGMAEPGEVVGTTLTRELGEETGAKLGEGGGHLVYCGYVDDWRNTDNAWMETVAAHWHFDKDEAESWVLKAGDDAKHVAWYVVTPEFLATLYASHGLFLRTALSNLAEREIEYAGIIRTLLS